MDLHLAHKHFIVFSISEISRDKLATPGQADGTNDDLNRFNMQDLYLQHLPISAYAAHHIWCSKSIIVQKSKYDYEN